MQARSASENNRLQNVFFFVAIFLSILTFIAGVTLVVIVERKDNSDSSSLKPMVHWKKIADNLVNSSDSFNIMSPIVNCDECIKDTHRVSETIYVGIQTRANSPVADMKAVVFTVAPSQSPIVSTQVPDPSGGECCIVLMNKLRLRADTSVFINPTNTQGVSPVLTLASFLSANDEVRNTLGESLTFVKNFTLVNEPMTPGDNGRNEIFFAGLSNQPESMNIIGISIVYFVCWDFNQVSQKCIGDLQINTHKIIFNVQDFMFGDSKQMSQVMDLPSVAAHEYGHGQGLGDFRGDSCAGATMFATINTGETKKRTFHATDKQCLSFLYEQSVQTGDAMPLGPWKTYFLLIMYFLSL